MYGFVLLSVPRDRTPEKKLAGLGVQLLGPHDDHHKARLPVGSLEALAALPEVDWLGVSAPEQKLSVSWPRCEARRGRRPASAPRRRSRSSSTSSRAMRRDFRRELEAVGATLGEYDPELDVLSRGGHAAAIEKIAALDFVLFVELIGATSPGHDQSTPLIDADMIRPGSPFGLTRFSGAPMTARHPRHGLR